MKALYKKYTLDFKRPSGTSRGVLTQKETWFLILEENGKYGIGECGILRGLSIDDVPSYEDQLRWTCENIHLGKDALWEALQHYPSIQFGVEQAFLSLSSADSFELFPSDFTSKEAKIPINGLVWMGDETFMLEQIQQKLEDGFQCIKMKIGAIDFVKELNLLSSIRKKYSKGQVQLRLDANGAFSPDRALEKLKILSDYHIHSIEQPIRQGDLWHMRGLCEKSPIPIALDEELIGIFDSVEKDNLLKIVNPAYIILKPSLVGGYRGSEEWIKLAKKRKIKWWATSALESNIGLNAISQWTFIKKNKLPQGLGTGSLYTNNIDSPLTVTKGTLYYDRNKNWKTNLIKELCT